MSTLGMHFSWPPMTPGVRLLIWINLLVAFANLLTGGWISDWAGVSLGHVTSLYGLGIVTIVTSIFVHSFLNPMHLLGNMLVLWIFGGWFAERRTGYLGILRLYMGAGIFGSIVFLLTNAVTGIDTPAVGASGAVLGILTFAAAADPSRTIYLIIIPIQLGWLAALYVFFDFWTYALLVGRGLDSSTAVAAHLGGAAYGVFAFHALRGFHDTSMRYEPYGREGFFGLWPGSARGSPNASSARPRARPSGSANRQRNGRRSWTGCSTRSSERAWTA
jgi:membrane associated rhomboid family serine protease